jgi:hypothetical protein
MARTWSDEAGALRGGSAIRLSSWATSRGLMAPTGRSFQCARSSASIQYTSCFQDFFFFLL